MGARFTRRAPRWLLPSLLLILGLILLRVSCQEGSYETAGQRAHGVVLRKTVFTDANPPEGEGRAPATRHYVSYRFTTREGQTLEGTSEVLSQTWEALDEGSPVVVEYLPSSPDTHRLVEQQPGSATWGIVALVLLIASTALFYVGSRKGR